MNYVLCYVWNILLFPFVDNVLLSNCDSLDFNYNLFNVGPWCTNLAWNYIGQSCRPASYTLQGFQLIDVTSGQLNSPQVTFSSQSATFTLSASEVATENSNLYFRIIALDSQGRVCNAVTLTKFYNFTMLFHNGMFVALV